MSSSVVDVDKIWIALGQWGAYQRRHICVLLAAVLSCSIHVLSIVFLGYRPSYSCTEIPEDNITSQIVIHNKSVSRQYEECSIKLISNHSGTVTITRTGCTDGWSYIEEDCPFSKERSFVAEWDLVCEGEELAEVSQTLVMLGQGLGAFIFTSLSDRLGRKPVHITCHITLFAITLVTAFVPNYSSFAVMRILTGAFQQGTGLSLAILTLELMPKETRGYMEVLNQLVWSTGIAIITPIGYIFRNLSWRYLQICLSCLSAWSLVQWWFVDESLRWLIANGKLKEAKAIIIKACKENLKNYEDVSRISGFDRYELQNGIELHIVAEKDNEILEGLTEPLTTQNGDLERPSKRLASKSYTFVDLLKSRRLFLASIILWFAWITNSATYYGLMLISSSLAGDRFLNFFLGSVVEYPAVLMEFVMLNRYGRKLTAITFLCICGVALITATVLLTTADGSPAILVGSTVFTLIGKFGITGSFSIIFLYTPELYPTNMRNVGIGMSSAAARIGGMVAPFSRNMAEVAVWAPGLVFGIMCAIASVSMLWIPETNQYELPQTLEECEQWYHDNRFKLSCNRRHSTRSEVDQTMS